MGIRGSVPVRGRQNRISHGQKTALVLCLGFIALILWNKFSGVGGDVSVMWQPDPNGGAGNYYWYDRQSRREMMPATASDYWWQQRSGMFTFIGIIAFVSITLGISALTRTKEKSVEN
jgi:hypothetical protein